MTNGNKNTTELLKSIKISTNTMNNKVESEPIKIKTSSSYLPKVDNNNDVDVDDDPISVNIKHIEFPSIEATMNFKKMLSESEKLNNVDKKWNYNQKEKVLTYDFSDDEDEYNYRKYVIKNIHNKSLSSSYSDFDSYEY
jgi:hypothetical protein